MIDAPVQCIFLLSHTKCVTELVKDLDLVVSWGLGFESIYWQMYCIVPSLCQASRVDYNSTFSRMCTSCEWTYNVHLLYGIVAKHVFLWLHTVKYATYQKWHHGLYRSWTECRLEQLTSTHSTSSWSWSSIGYLLNKQIHSELGVATHLRNTTKCRSLAK